MTKLTKTILTAIQPVYFMSLLSSFNIELCTCSLLVILYLNLVTDRNSYEHVCTVNSCCLCNLRHSKIRTKWVENFRHSFFIHMDGCVWNIVTHWIISGAIFDFSYHRNRITEKCDNLAVIPTIIIPFQNDYQSADRNYNFDTHGAYSHEAGMQ